MTEAPTALVRHETRAAVRLNRLFKIELNGGFDRWPVATLRQLIDRRAALLAELLRMEEMRRALAEPPSPELDRAMTELTGEVNRGLHRTARRIAEINRDLRVRLGETRPTGIRGDREGQLLGRT